MARAVQDYNQTADGRLTLPYVIRLFSRGFQELSHLLLIIRTYCILSKAQRIRVIAVGTHSFLLHNAEHASVVWLIEKMYHTQYNIKSKLKDAKYRNLPLKIIHCSRTCRINICPSNICKILKAIFHTVRDSLLLIPIIFVKSI